MVVKITYVNGEVEEFDVDSWMDNWGTFVRIIFKDRKTIYIPTIQIRRIE